MKKILLLMAIALSLVLVSCSDDKEENEPEEEPVYLEQLVIGEWTSQDAEYVYKYVFRSSFTGEYTQSWIGGTIKFNRSYSWSLIGNVLKCISPFNEKLGDFVLTYENGVLYMVDSRGLTFTKIK